MTNENKEKKEAKRPAHKVIIEVISGLYKVEDNNASQISLLASVLLGMKIPSEEVANIRKELFEIFTSYGAHEVHAENIESIRIFLSQFGKEYSS